MAPVTGRWVHSPLLQGQDTASALSSREPLNASGLPALFCPRSVWKAPGCEGLRPPQGHPPLNGLDPHPSAFILILGPNP